MRKLNLRKIRWILKEMKKGELSVYQIAKQQKVTPRWVRQLPRKYRGISPYKIRIKKPGKLPIANNKNFATTSMDVYLNVVC